MRVNKFMKMQTSLFLLYDYDFKMSIISINYMLSKILSFETRSRVKEYVLMGSCLSI